MALREARAERRGAGAQTESQSRARPPLPVRARIRAPGPRIRARFLTPRCAVTGKEKDTFSCLPRSFTRPAPLGHQVRTCFDLRTAEEQEQQDAYGALPIDHVTPDYLQRETRTFTAGSIPSALEWFLSTDEAALRLNTIHWTKPRNEERILAEGHVFTTPGVFCICVLEKNPNEGRIHLFSIWCRREIRRRIKAGVTLPLWYQRLEAAKRRAEEQKRKAAAQEAATAKFARSVKVNPPRPVCAAPSGPRLTCSSTARAPPSLHQRKPSGNTTTSRRRWRCG